MTDQAGEGAGDDPRYSGHLLTAGRLFVAESAEEIVGYAATVVVNDADMLTDLFVLSDRHGVGIGKALLDEVWSGATDRMTLSSAHPSALPLYIRHGMTPRWPVLYLRGDPPRCPRGYAVEEVSHADAARCEREISGVDRSRDYEYWAARPQARVFLVRRDRESVAVGAVGGVGKTNGISHLMSAASVHAEPSLMAALSLTDTPSFLAIPGPHPGVSGLVERGWRLVDVDQFAATSDRIVDPTLCCPHSGLM
ncbi:MAG: GNAT family N-acetyltransferase [Candidatus Nanopelagicales bacterium]